MTDGLAGRRPSQIRIEAVRDRLYGLLPAHIRSVDAANGWALKALIQVVAVGSAEIDQEIDTLYESMFVETASEAALADLAAIVAAEPLRPLPPGAGHSPRAFIANTVRYRRGKGTARVLEALSADVGGFGAVAVEYFMRLARTQHLIDVRPERPGFANLIAGETAARAGTAFDRLPRLLDVRSIARAGGRHHHQTVGVHLLRPEVPVFGAPDGDSLSPDKLAGVPQARPWPDGANQHPGYFQLSAQPGRVLRLFNPDRRGDDSQARAAETELRDRLRRLPLHLETEERRKASLEGRDPRLATPPWFDDLQGLPFTLFFRRAGSGVFERVPPAKIVISNLDQTPNPPTARPANSRNYQWFTGGATAPAPHSLPHEIACGFDPVTGRLIVAQPAAGQPDVEEVRIAYGYGIGRPIGAGPQERNTADVPFDLVNQDGLTHQVWVVDSTLAPGPLSVGVTAVATLADALAGWVGAGQGKRGLIVLARCEREGAVSPATEIEVRVHPGSELHIVAAQWRPKNRDNRPGVTDNPDRLGYVVRRDRRFTIDAPLRIVAASPPPPPPPEIRPGVLVLDGLELTRGLSLGVRAVSRLTVRHCTVRNPGKPAVSTTAALQGMEVAIDRSIVGRIALDFGSATVAGALKIIDSLVSADEAAGAAIAASGLDADLGNVTILGESQFKSLEATNVIFTAAASAVRRQAGCVRYSWVAEGSALPRRFRCQPDLGLAQAHDRKGAALTPAEAASVRLGLQPLFLDTDLDEPTVAMLHAMTRDAIRLGGEGENEMGVFSAAADGLRKANIVSLFNDFTPFGLEAGLIDDTRSTAVATRRNRP